MLAMLFIRIVWTLWFIGTLSLLGYALSNTLFRSMEKRPTRFWRDVFVALLWPLMLLSPSGRKRIKQTMKGIL